MEQFNQSGGWMGEMRAAEDFISEVAKLTAAKGDNDTLYTQILSKTMGAFDGADKIREFKNFKNLYIDFLDKLLTGPGADDRNVGIETLADELYAAHGCINPEEIKHEKYNELFKNLWRDGRSREWGGFKDHATMINYYTHKAVDVFVAADNKNSTSETRDLVPIEFLEFASLGHNGQFGTGLAYHILKKHDILRRPKDAPGVAGFPFGQAGPLQHSDLVPMAPGLPPQNVSQLNDEGNPHPLRGLVGHIPIGSAPFFSKGQLFCDTTWDKGAPGARRPLFIKLSYNNTNDWLVTVTVEGLKKQDNSMGPALTYYINGRILKMMWDASAGGRATTAAKNIPIGWTSDEERSHFIYRGQGITNFWYVKELSTPDENAELTEGIDTLGDKTWSHYFYPIADIEGYLPFLTGTKIMLEEDKNYLPEKIVYLGDYWDRGTYEEESNISSIILDDMTKGAKVVLGNRDVNKARLLIEYFHEETLLGGGGRKRRKRTKRRRRRKSGGRKSRRKSGGRKSRRKSHKKSCNCKKCKSCGKKSRRTKGKSRRR
jgi:hypothetical protein